MVPQPPIGQAPLGSAPPLPQQQRKFDPTTQRTLDNATAQKQQTLERNVFGGYNGREYKAPMYVGQAAPQLAGDQTPESQAIADRFTAGRGWMSPDQMQAKRMEIAQKIGYKGNMGGSVGNMNMPGQQTSPYATSGNAGWNGMDAYQNARANNWGAGPQQGQQQGTPAIGDVNDMGFNTDMYSLPGQLGNLMGGFAGGGGKNGGANPQPSGYGAPGTQISNNGEIATIPGSGGGGQLTAQAYNPNDPTMGYVNRGSVGIGNAMSPQRTGIGG
jgi:hypothetical protein